MKPETLTLLIVVGAVAAGGYILYRQQQAKLATKIQTPQQNPNQINTSVSPQNRPLDYVNAGISALDKIAEHYGGF
jgi:hypothetical protein